MFVGGGGGRWFVIWMTNCFLEVHKVIICKWNFPIHVILFFKEDELVFAIISYQVRFSEFSSLKFTY